MERLLEGYRRFRDTEWPAEKARYESLAHWGQSPQHLIVACSDSRVDPQTVFGAVPGELFVIRNVAGLVPPYEPDAHYHGASAALEYGVRVLKIPNLVVLGHGRCGGVQAMVQGAPNAQDFVEPWMKMAEPILKNVPLGVTGEDLLAFCEAEVVKLSLANLMSFPWVADAVAGGKLTVQGFRFDISTGLLMQLDGERFVPIV
ncbi:MAG: cynT [Rhodospirillales bacterium]|jgi:carbonic anhydrase|nr:cynT [Rhodospirillales bacterium]